ncbi:hypothetical protein T4E_11526 [Trichinella pseudospiralis]|uniref:Uncharacterized protein n=1 Tax=Trichinella pseudospiralis TaxID=6337 RepID=A0A0V0XNT4_TRIPS|nr:hypothetical protein T4E_11526 [Trichinella pseudospiralis]
MHYFRLANQRRRFYWMLSLAVCCCHLDRVFWLFSTKIARTNLPSCFDRKTVLYNEALSFEIPGPRKSIVDNSKLYLTDILKLQQPTVLKLLAFIYTEMLTRRVTTCRTLMKFNQPGEHRDGIEQFSMYIPGFVPYLWISIRDICYAVLGDFNDFIVEEKYTNVTERIYGGNAANSHNVSSWSFDGPVHGRKEDEISILKGKIRSEVSIPGALKLLPVWLRQFCITFLYGVSPKVYDDYQLVMWAARILTNVVCLSFGENSLSVVQLDANNAIQLLKDLNAALNYHIEVFPKLMPNIPGQYGILQMCAEVNDEITCCLNRITKTTGKIM